MVYNYEIGTGKTTVAKLFSEILSVAGVRSGHKFLTMTATEALRKGAVNFAKELSSLTGSTTGVGPPSNILLVGSRVMVEFQDKWYPATIMDILPPVSEDEKIKYVVKTDNDLQDPDVDASRIHPIDDDKNKDGQGGGLYV